MEKLSVPLKKPTLVREVGRPGWMMLNAVVMRALSLSAHTEDLELKIARPVKMQEWSVQVWHIHCLLYTQTLLCDEMLDAGVVCVGESQLCLISTGQFIMDGWILIYQTIYEPKKLYLSHSWSWCSFSLQGI